MNAKKARTMLSEELWTASNVNLISDEEIKNSEILVSKLTDAEDRQDFKLLCEQELEENPNAVLPRFMLTLCGRHPIDDSYAFTVFDDFYREGKTAEAIHVGKTILSFNESPYLLRALADCYRILGDEESKISVWEQLIKADHNETEVFYELADYYVAKGDTQAALDCYKRVILRHINTGDLNSIKNIWPKVMALKGDNTDYLIQLASRIARTLGNANGVYFLNEVYQNGGDYDVNCKIKILKKILELEPKTKNAVEELISLFREKYKDNSRLEYCLSDTGLLYNYMDADVAVQKFEKEIEFTEGAFVYHNTWKLGRIRKIEKDEMFIQFMSKKDLHKMSCNMAFSSLRILPKQHIWVLKAGVSAEKIKERMLSDTCWGLKMILNSFNGQASFKQMKAELVPSVLKEAEWSVWQANAKKELASNPYFSTSDESNDIYILRDTPITFEEKEYQLFSREKGFFNKYAIVKDFIKKNGITDSDEFMRMLAYFEAELKTGDYTAFCSYIILNRFKTRYDMNFIHLPLTFADLYEKLSAEDAGRIYGAIEDPELRRLFIDHIMETDDNWQTVLSVLLHVNPSAYIIDKIKEGPKKRLLNDILSDAVEHPQSDPDLSLYLFRNYSPSDWKKARFTDEEIMTSKLELLIFVSGKISHGVDTQENRARKLQLTDSLFGGQEIINFLGSCDTSEAKRIWSYLSNVPDLGEDKLLGIKHYIVSNRDDADIITGAAEEPVTPGRIIPKGFLCTRAMYVRKTAELEHIMNVEIPENSREIGTARDLGDLRENAEYQYAKDKQKNLNFMMNKLTDEIDMAKIIDPDDVDIAFVEFGTVATFHDNISGKDVVYTILGPWESNPEQNILNFQAPLGLKLYNMTLDENKKFEINGVKYDYTVKNISLADFNIA